MSLPGAWPAAPDGMPASITSGPWLTSHGWQLEPEPLCPAHSNSIKD